ncbi:MAG: carboxypeptidase-like regulatory domain-containing protein [Bacteroidales bacterium]|jgi:outer membrane cobalamin receptor|nr:carboxypeptidase-like regulatory domain-containing protein [Bacteroidales bacterium]
MSKGILILVSLLSFSLQAFTQRDGDRNAVIRGTVKNEKGEPVEYASIYIKSTQSGTQSDAEGKFVLQVLPGAQTLCVQSLGHVTHEKQIDPKPHGRIDLEIQLEDSRHNLDEVVVEARGPVQRIRESSFNVIAVNAEALHHTSLDISHALDRVSGVKIRETGGMGSTSHVSLNGFSGRHVKIFMDGMPMESFGSSFRLNNIPVHVAERIEVYKGVVPIELGSDALGGAINIVTGQSRRTFVDVSYSYGSFNTHKSNISLGHTAKNGFFVRLNAYQNYSDNRYKVKTRLLDLETNGYSQEEHWFRRFHDNYHNEAAIVKAGVVRKPWADRLQVELTVSREKQDIQNANLMKIVYGGRERKAQSVVPALYYEKRNLFTEGLNLRISANYSLARNSNTDTLARQYNWQGEYRAKSFKGEGQYTMGEYDNRNASVSTGLSYRFNGRHLFSFNNLYGNFSRKATDAAANAETSTAATFMRRTNLKNVSGLSYRFEPSKRWNVSGFVKRYDVLVRGPINVSTTTTATYEEQKRDFGTTGYGIGATVFPVAEWQLKASLEKAFRLPSENELFGDESLETGDAGLKPENSLNLNVNISYEHTFGKAHSVYFDAGLIYRDTRDYIRRQIEQRYGGAFYTNHGRVRNLGADVEARYFYRKTFSAGGNFTIQDIRNMERYSAAGRKLIYYRDRMPNVPYMFGNVDANCNLNNCFGRGNVLSFGYNMRFIHSFFRDWESEGGDIIIPRQLSHDLSILYSIRDGRYSVAVEALNIADAILYDNYSLQKPGRSFLLKFRYFLYR